MTQPWGSVADLIAVLDVREVGPDTYRGLELAAEARPVVEGSQLLAQALVAASRRSPGRRVTSAHMVFYRAADARLPLTLVVRDLSNGRTFTTVEVTAEQDGRAVATGILQLDATAPDVVRHAAAAPPCAGPAESEAYSDMGVAGRELRVADAAYTNDSGAPVGPPVIDAWLRYADAPRDPVVGAALLAQFTGHMSIAAALRPHAGIGQDQAHRTISTGINAITLSLHAEVPGPEWMRFHHHSTFAGDGMTHSECRVYSEAGGLLASFSVEGMVRPFAKAAHSADSRTAL